ncbi:S8 family serine peptidase [Trichocoleus sp. FACHB-591]|uniref:S8 family serine peptidase n=1 Tax=Trichocoleus sp. FACHB-591 TaxID=2692872 RepID=UPI001685EF4C|nr:S8 family serine peptidase [Trichocoleus sp. FACHB-591]MBD2096492.1 S8 family serine peptidase [Trichocoleus sp. FACHB-591]
MLEPLPLDSQVLSHFALPSNSAAILAGETDPNLGASPLGHRQAGPDALSFALENWSSLQPILADASRFRSEVFSARLEALPFPETPATSNPITPLSTYELDTLSGSSNFSGFVDSYNPQDIYYFQLDTTSDLDLSLTNLATDADLYLAQDTNQNGAIETDEIIASSIEGDTTSEAIALTGLEAGDYAVIVEQYIGGTSYSLNLTADAAGNTLFEARDLGLLVGTSSYRDFVGNSDPQDFYRFSLEDTSNLNLSLSELENDADLFLFQDLNDNGLMDDAEVLASSLASDSQPETINFGSLAAGTYSVLIDQYIGDTNYNFSLTASQLVQTVWGSLEADTFTLIPGASRMVFSGNGNLEFGTGEYDLLDLSHLLSTDVTFNLATTTGGGLLYDPGNGDRLFDALTLGDGREILFESIDSIAFADTTFDLSVTPNDPLFNEQWNLHMMGVHNAWRFTTGSEEVLVGVQDSGLGVDADGFLHPDLRTTTIFSDNYNDDSTDLSHGTAVQSIIAANVNNGIGMSGINWNSSVINIDVLGGETGDYSLAEATAAMIAEAARQGQRLVINMSLGGGGLEPDFEALVANHQEDVLFVIASGNGDQNSLLYPAQLAARYNNVIAVGASWGAEDMYGNSQTPGTRISYPDFWGSNYGEGLTLMGPSEVVATGATPAGSGTNFGYETQFNGTSAATPNVAGVASLVWSINSELTATQVREILSTTAYDLGDPGYDEEYGDGFVNADAAVRRAIALA